MTATTEPYTRTHPGGVGLVVDDQGSNGGALQLAITETESAGTTPREITTEDVEFTADGYWAARCPRCGHHEILVALGPNPDVLVLRRELRAERRELRRLRECMARVADHLQRRART